MRAAVLVIGSLLLALFVAVQGDWLAGRAPTDLGVRDGRLKPPSPTRNSVSSQTYLHPGHPQAAYAFVMPLPWRQADSAMSLQMLRAVLTDTPGITIVEDHPDYVRAEARTPWLRFVDDLEFWVNPQRQVIDVRSASRLGREDFGVNRKRLESIRMRYLAAAVPTPH